MMRSNQINPLSQMMPFLNHHKSVLGVFLNELWNFYELLTRYKENANEPLKTHIQQRFNVLFSTVTGYRTLDERIEMTRKKKASLLMVLDCPDIPLHNNCAEIAVREGVIKRKISYGTRSDLGKLAWEYMLSVMDTCWKLGITLSDLISISRKSTEY